LIAYDITNPGRLRLVARLLEGYLSRIQKSVFEGKLTSSQLFSLKQELDDIIDDEKDSVIIIPLSSLNIEQMEVMGKEINATPYLVG
jgi:CRISPR-associated protein Cas2